MVQVGMARYAVGVLVALLMATAVKAETIIIEGSPGLPVATSFVIKFFSNSPWVKERLQGKDFIESRLVLSTKNGMDLPHVVTAIPAPTGKHIPYSPDYLVSLSGGGCFVFVNSPNQITDSFEFDCTTLGAAFLVKARAECAAEGGTWDAGRDGACFADNEGKCVGRGGKWMRIGMRRFLVCLHQYSDGGKDCTDDSQCAGGCVDAGRKPDKDGMIVGKCEEYEWPCPSSTRINNGKYDRRFPVMFCD